MIKLIAFCHCYNIQLNLIKMNTLNANVYLARIIFPVCIGFHVNVVLTSLLNTNTDIEKFPLTRTVCTF